MLFNSLIFLVFLPIVFSIYWLLKPNFRNIFLLFASYYFYFSYNPWFLLLLIGTSSLDFYMAKAISATEHQAKRKLLLLTSILSNIGVLFIFKYFVFFYNSGISLFSENPSLLSNFIIPAGLSFYTFQSISYTIDVYRGNYKANDKLTDFLLFVSFFPHMVAGPIMKHGVLMPQIKKQSYFKTINWESFAKLIIWGFFKKMVIADNLSLLVNLVFDNPIQFNSIELFLTGILFLIQLYCDFSGYTDIASGVAKLFNINFSINWKRPLLATSVIDYWKRHHISLTTWFKDYVYISLGGNKVSTSRWIFNLIIVFVISGLWHGANYTFIIWGLLNGIIYAIESIINKRNLNLKIPKVLTWAYSISIISLFFIAFRALNISNLIDIYKGIFVTPKFNGGIDHILSLQDRIFYPIVSLVILILFAKELIEEYQLNSKYIWLTKLSATFYVIILLLIFIFGNFNANTFIYFQF